MNESAVNQWLEDRRLLSKAAKPGCYAIALALPRSKTEIQDRWHRYYEICPQEAFLSRLVDCETLLYVGAAHQSIKQRLNDHANGYKSPTFLKIFPPIEPYAFLPCENPEGMEYNYASWLSRKQTRVWSDGGFY